MEQIEKLEPLIAIDCLKSQTRIPVLKRTNDGIYVIDTPGFKDTEGAVQEAVNAFCNFRILQKVEYLKFLFVSKWSDIIGNASLFVQNIQNFVDMYKDVKFLEKGFSMLITRVPQGINMKEIVEILERVYKKSTPLKQCPKARRLLEIVLSLDQKENETKLIKVYCFAEPKVGDFAELNVLEDMDYDTDYISMKSHKSEI